MYTCCLLNRITGKKKREDDEGSIRVCKDDLMCEQIFIYENVNVGNK